MRREVIRRAGGRCEYCLIHQDDAAARHQVDHVIAVKHGGHATLDNLALSCLFCNRRKASDIGSIDPESGQFVRLFDPRRQAWSGHFQVVANEIIGRTQEGRATAEFLQLNLPERLQERSVLIALGRLP
jgi:hypothetical protein